MRRLRKWVQFAVAAAIVAGGIAYAGLSYLAFDRLTGVAPRCADRFPAYTPASFGTLGIEEEFAAGFDTTQYAMPAYSEVEFSSRDTKLRPGSLRGWWIPARDADAPAIVVVHGWNSCRRDPVTLLPAGMLARNGFSVLLIDMRDHGDSVVEDGRSAWGTEEYLDVLGAWDWLRTTQHVPAGRIGIAGESLGAASSIVAMAEEPLVAATWEDSGYTDVGTLFAEKIGEQGFPGLLEHGAIAWSRILAGDDLGSRSPIGAVERIGNRPLAIVHGLADTSIPVHHATDLAAAHARSVPGSEAWLVPRAPHLQAAFADPQEYERRIVAFFRAALAA